MPAKHQRTRVQHYVPQLYLRGFATPSQKLFCYDKLQDTSYPTTIYAAAQESFFYEVPPGTTTEPVPVNAIERKLGELETEWAPRLSALIASADADNITHEQLAYFSPFVALQWMRTRTHRDTLHAALNQLGQTHANDLIKLNFPGEDLKVRVTFPETGMPAIQAEQMLDPDVILQMARDLDRHIWVIGINNTGRPLYTSDHPVVRRANRKDGDRWLVGVRDLGIEFAFPLDARHLLLILERGHFKDWKSLDSRTAPLTLDQVADYNQLQVMKSGRWVYCLHDEFEIARTACIADPRIRDPNRPRVNVETTPMVGVGDTMRNYVMVTALE